MPDKTLEKIIQKILEVIIPDKIILFGSRAKGTAREDSDYDLLIIKSDIKNKRELNKKLYRNMLGTNASVDIILETSEIIEEYKDSVGFIYKFALNEGKVVYAK
jgi:predicted nucleotidyltransferase